MLARDYTPSFQLRLGRKDVALALDAARTEELDLRLGAALLDAMDVAVARGYGESDIAAVHESTSAGSA